MRRRIFILILAAAVALSALGATVLAAEGDISAPEGPVEQAGNSQAEEPADISASSAEPGLPAEGSEGKAEDPAPAEPPAEDASPAEDAPLTEDESPAEDATPAECESPAEDTPPAEDGPDAVIPEYTPDPVGTISFDNIGPRMREGNLNVLALEENIQVIRSIDYDELTEDVRKGLNKLASTQWSLVTAGSSIDLGPGMGQLSQALSGMMSMSTASTSQQLQSQYDAMRETFDDLKSGKLQSDNEDLIRQLTNAQNQIIMAGQSLYIALASMEQSGQTVSRGLDTLDRTLEELELRYQLGQISAHTLEQARGGRVSLLSGQRTLNSSIETYKIQLEMLIGAKLTGNIRLSALPQVSGQELDAMNLEADLEAAKKASYSLYEAKQTLDQAEKDFKDADKKYNHSDKHYEYVQAKHQWQAAQYNYSAAVQNFEMGLRTLYLKVKDNKQVLEAAKDSLSVERKNYAVAQLKHTQGSLSESDLLEAEDAVKQAQETVDSAAIELFSSYNSYRWAVDYGILNT